MAARFFVLLPARLVAAALVVAMPVFAGQMFPWQTLACTLVVAVCAVVMCVGLLHRGTGVAEEVGAPRDRLAEGLLVAFLGWMVLATFRTVYLHASLLALLQMASYVVFLALWRRLFAEHRTRVWGWGAVAAAGAVAGFYGVRDWTHTVIFQGDMTWRAFGTFYNPNCLAGYCLVVLPAAVVAVAHAWRAGAAPQGLTRPRYELIFAGFALLLPAVALLLTASRAGVLGAGLGALVFLLGAPGRLPRRWLALAAGGLVLLVVLAPPLRTRLLQVAGESHSALFRWYTWRGTVATIAARPLLGHGPGTFEYAYQPHALTGFTRMAHQTPLQIAAEGGVPAALLLLCALALLAWKLVLSCREGGLRGVESAAGLTALAALGFQNLADYTWYVPAVGLTLSAVLGLALAAADGEAARARPRPWRCWSGLVLGLVVISACGVGLQAQSLAGQGRAALSRGAYTLARGWLTRAVRLDPLDAEIWGELSEALAGGGGEGNLRAAVAARRRAIALCPLKSGHHLMLALLLDVLGDEEGAIAAARRSVEVGPNHPRAFANLARLLMKAGRTDEAMQVYRQLERIYNSPVGKYQAVTQTSDYAYAEAWVALGQEALRGGDRHRAADYFERAATLAGQYAAEARAQESMLRQIGAWDEMRVLDAERLAAEANLLLARAREAEGEHSAH